MKVPKPVLIGLLFTAALFAGYQVNEAMHDEPLTAAATQAAPAAALSAIDPEMREPVVINLTLATTGSSPEPATVMNLTMNIQNPSGEGSPNVQEVSAVAPATGRGVNGAGGANVTLAAEPRLPGVVPSPRGNPSRSTVAGNVIQAPVARATGSNGDTIQASLTQENMMVDMGDRGDTTQDFSITAIGNNIVIAYGNSVAFAGDHGYLTANTGNAAASGTIALDVSDSNVTSGMSVTTPTSTRTTVAEAPRQPGFTTDGFDPTQSVPGRALSMSGYEDHSLNVAGRDHVVTYDDSNVFIARDGQINANTGDTDSAGLNVVDAIGSVVRSGDHNEDGTDNEEGDDSDDSDSESEEPASPVQADNANSAVTVPDSAPGDDNADDDALLVDPARPQAPVVPARANASVSGDEGEDSAGTTAGGDEAVVVGGDGYDNLSVDVMGEGHVVSYDDSNVVIGGSGGVNAQIGDSDTAGAVVMGVRNSVIIAGDSS